MGGVFGAVSYTHLAAKWIAGRLRHRHADIAVKIAGLCVVIAGFVMIFI